MNLSCFICIFLLTNFVFGSSSENEEKKSGSDAASSAAIDEPEKNDVATDHTDEDTNKDTNKDTDRHSNKDTDKDSNKDSNKDTDKDTDKYSNKDTDKDSNKDTDKDTDKDSNKDTDNDSNKGSNKDTDNDSNKGSNKDTDNDSNKGSNKDTDKNTDKDTDKDTNKDTDTDTNKDTDKDTDGDDRGVEELGQNSRITGNLPFWNGFVPYYINRDSYDDIIVDRIVAATKILEKESCLQFLHLDDKDKTFKHGKYYLHFDNPDKKRECVHSVARGKEGEPMLVLGYDCMQKRDILHALMHILGFSDEVTHPYRDYYIRVLWENIQPKYRHLFAMTKINMYHQPPEYDMMSIMHFHPTAYSINGAPTTLPLRSGGMIMPSDKLSVLDKMKLRLAFTHECNRRKVSKLLGTCVNAIQGDGNSACSGGSEADDGKKSGFSNVPDRNINMIGTHSDNIEAISGTDKHKTETSSGSDKDKKEASSGSEILSGGETEKIIESERPTSDFYTSDNQKSKSRVKFVSGTDRDKTEASSGTDRDKTEASSGTDKDRIGVSSGSDKDKTEVSSGGEGEISSDNLYRNEKPNALSKRTDNKSDKKSLARYLRRLKKHSYKL